MRFGKRSGDYTRLSSNQARTAFYIDPLDSMVCRQELNRVAVTIGHAATLLRLFRPAARKRLIAADIIASRSGSHWR